MNEIQKYFRYRQSLIDQYVKGDMTKSEYLSKNLDAVLALNIKPFRNIDTVEKALFNYQYYNAMAKEAKILSNDNASGGNLSDVQYYYNKKDSATLKALSLLDYQSVTGYFVKVRSKYLKGKLIEIVIDDYQMILHTTSPVILANLRREGVFDEETKRSVIDGYINQRY